MQLVQYQNQTELMSAAEFISKSNIIPKEYQGNPSNCLIAMDMALRLEMSALAVMQNLNIIQGKPAWSGQYVIASVNSTGRFSPLRYEFQRDETEKEIEYSFTDWTSGQKQIKTKKVKFKNIECRAVATDLKSGEILRGTPVSIELAYREGWYDKNGSKWQSMPEQMLIYRAASFFGKVYAPEKILGLPTVDEVIETSEKEINPPTEKIKQIETILDNAIEDTPQVETAQVETALDQYRSELSRARSVEDVEAISEKYRGKISGKSDVAEAKKLHADAISSF